MNQPKPKELIGMYNRLKTLKSPLTALFNALTKYYQPDQQYQKTPNSEASEPDTPLDAIGIQMASLFASALFSNTIRMGMEWFALRCPDPEKMKIPVVRDWFTSATKQLTKALQNSNFALAVHEDLESFTRFCTGILGTEFDTQQRRLAFKTLKITNCCVSDNANDRTDTIAWEFMRTAKQAVEEYADPGKKVLDAYNKPDTMYDQFRFLIIIMPRPEALRDPQSLKPEDMQFAKYVINLDDETLVEESGYRTFPYAVHRMRKADDSPYGRGPSMDALGTLRMLNDAAKKLMDAADMNIAPPVFVPGDAEGYNLSAWSVNSYDPMNGGTPVVVNPSGDVGTMERLIERYDQQIREFFYVDLFMMLEERKNMTATEVVERINEKIQAIAPIGARQHSELYAPTIERSLNLGIKHGVIDPPPPELFDDLDPRNLEENGVPTVRLRDDFLVDYTTRLEAKLSEVENSQLLKSITQAGAAADHIMKNPALTMIINLEKAVRAIFTNNTVDPEILNDEKTIKKLKEDEAQRQAQQAATAALMDKIKPIDIQQPPGPGSMMEQIPSAPGEIEELPI